MTTERKYKKEVRRPPPEAAAAPVLAPAPPISDRERQRIQDTVAHVKTNLPDVVPMIKDLVDAGLIHGWRNVFISEK